MSSRAIAALTLGVCLSLSPTLAQEAKVPKRPAEPGEGALARLMQTKQLERLTSPRHYHLSYYGDSCLAVLHGSRQGPNLVLHFSLERRGGVQGSCCGSDPTGD